MDSINLTKFTASLKYYLEKITNQHTLLKVTDDQGKDFVVISAEDWEREQETLYIVQNTILIKQIAKSMKTHNKHKENNNMPSVKIDIEEIFGILQKPDIKTVSVEEMNNDIQECAGTNN